jgi:uncharacterized HAD superfamily protein
MRKAGIDLDGVLANVSYSIINYINGMYQTHYREGDIAEYHIHDWFPEVSKEEAASMFKNPGFYLNMPPIPKAIESINKLKEDGWWIDIVTARDWGCLTVTVDWLRDEGVQFDRLSFVDHDKKLSYASVEKFDFFVEDKPSTAKQLTKAVPLVYLVDAPYNRKLNDGVIRVKNLDVMLKDLKRTGLYGTTT